MPVTHGVRGSSPLRTAKKDNRKVILFFVFAQLRFEFVVVGLATCVACECECCAFVSKLPSPPFPPRRFATKPSTSASTTLSGAYGTAHVKWGWADIVMVYCSTYGLGVFYKVSALLLKQFESPTHRQENDVNNWYTGVYIVFIFTITQNNHPKFSSCYTTSKTNEAVHKTCWTASFYF